MLSVFPALPHPSTFWIPSTRVSSNASALASPFLPRFPPRSRDSLAGSSCRLQMASLFLNNSRYRPTRHLLSAGNRPRPKRMITLSGRWFFVEPRSIGAYLLADRASLSNHVAARPWTIYTAGRIPDYKRCVSWQLKFDVFGDSIATAKITSRSNETSPERKRSWAEKLPGRAGCLRRIQVSRKFNTRSISKGEFLVSRSINYGIT